MSLSKNKEKFLTEGIGKDSRQLFAAEIKSIARHYKKKHHISIFKNGETGLHRKTIEEKQKKLQEELNTEIASLEGEKKYAHYITSSSFLWNGGSYNNGHDLHEHTIGHAKNTKLKSLLKNYLNRSSFRKDLTDSDYEDINKIIENDPELKRFFDLRIENLISTLKVATPKKIKDCGLSNEEVCQEIDLIQKNLRTNEVVGYVFTDGAELSRRHFEVVIITKDAIIKPLSWYGLGGLIYSGSKPFPSVRFDSSLVLQDRPIKIPQAQADGIACGTLGLMYLKQLLKNNAQQLKEYSLSFPFYNDQEGKVSWFFYPSPHVLKYSQSSIYNKLLANMLNDDEKAQSIAHKGKKYQIATLRGLLQKSIEIAKQQGNQQIIEHNTKLLAQLPQFSQKWLEAYQSASERREAMMDDENSNRYLTYVSHRITNYTNEPESKSSQEKVKMEKQPIDLMAEANKYIERDQFFTLLESTISNKITSEVSRIKDPDRKRLLSDSREELIKIIHDAKQECEKNYVNNGIKNFSPVKLACITSVLASIENTLIENNPLRHHQNAGTIFGRYLYNIILALPICIYASIKGRNPNKFFYSMETTTEKNIKEFKQELSEINTNGETGKFEKIACC